MKDIPKDEEDTTEDVLKDLLKGIEEIIENAMENSLVQENEGSLPYSTPDEYRQVTGKRFRIKPHQQEAGMTREEAFAEFLETQRTSQGNDNPN